MYKDEQIAYTEKIRASLAHEKKPLALVHTFGCQQNESDSEHLRGMLAQMGYGFTESLDEADLVLYNTCAVRQNAELRVYGKLGELVGYKRKKPDMIIAVCGCMMQQEQAALEIKKRYRHVDIVFGTFMLSQFSRILWEHISTEKRVFDLSDDPCGSFDDMPIVRDSKYNAWLSVMYGCNNFCSYCIVPYVRGRERSRSHESILEEAARLVRDGVKDITLLGQNVNSYGKDRQEEINFPELLKRVNAIEGDFRIRFMTSHPKDATQELFSAIAQCEKVVRHVHLPFQSGSDRILRLMNRRYTRDDYIGLCSLAREYMPGLSITSDVIVGFPTETEEDFEDTLDVVKAVRFDSLFTFQYSKRSGTPAAEMEGQIEKSAVQNRFERLNAVQDGISLEINEALVGKTVRVLCDKYEDGRMTGRTDSNKIVNFDCNGKKAGQFANIKITQAQTWSLKGEYAGCLTETEE